MLLPEQDLSACEPDIRGIFRNRERQLIACCRKIRGIRKMPESARKAEQPDARSDSDDSRQTARAFFFAAGRHLRSTSQTITATTTATLTRHPMTDFAVGREEGRHFYEFKHPCLP